MNINSVQNKRLPPLNQVRGRNDKPDINATFPSLRGALAVQQSVLQNSIISIPCLLYWTNINR